MIRDAGGHKAFLEQERKKRQATVPGTATAHGSVSVDSALGTNEYDLAQVRSRKQRSQTIEVEEAAEYEEALDMQWAERELNWIATEEAGKRERAKIHAGGRGCPPTPTAPSWYYTSIRIPWCTL